MASLSDVFANIISRVRVLEVSARSVSAYYNLCVNGGLEIWSHGVGPFTANNAETADTWFITLGAGSTIQVFRDDINFAALYSAHGATVIYVHTGLETTLRHAISGPFIDSPVGFSVRVKTSQQFAVRLKIGSLYSAYHSGSDQYETLILPAVRPTTQPFNAEVAFDATCTAYVDNIMCVQGSGPIDYVPFTEQDDARRITDY